MRVLISVGMIAVSSWPYHLNPLKKQDKHQKESRTFNHSTPPGTFSTASNACTQHTEMHWTDEPGIFKWEAMATV